MRMYLQMILCTRPTIEVQNLLSVFRHGATLLGIVPIGLSSLRRSERQVGQPFYEDCAAVNVGGVSLWNSRVRTRSAALRASLFPLRRVQGMLSSRLS